LLNHVMNKKAFPSSVVNDLVEFEK